MDWINPDFRPIFTVRRRVRKYTRTELRKLIKNKKRTHHGGRGKMYGLKCRKKPKGGILSKLIAELRAK